MSVSLLQDYKTMRKRAQARAELTAPSLRRLGRSRQGRVVLVGTPGLSDLDTGGSHTVKIDERDHSWPPERGAILTFGSGRTLKARHVPPLSLPRRTGLLAELWRYFQVRLPRSHKPKAPVPAIGDWHPIICGVGSRTCELGPLLAGGQKREG